LKKEKKEWSNLEQKKKKKEEADNMNIGRFSAVFVELTPLSPHPLLPSTWKSPRLAQN